MSSDRDLLKQALKTLEIAKRVANCAYNTGQSSIQWDSNIRPTIDKFDDLSPKVITALRERLAQPEQDYREALRVLSLALEEDPGRLTPKQRSVWEKSRDVLCSGGGWA